MTEGSSINYFLSKLAIILIKEKGESYEQL